MAMLGMDMRLPLQDRSQRVIAERAQRLERSKAEVEASQKKDETFAPRINNGSGWTHHHDKENVAPAHERLYKRARDKEVEKEKERVREEERHHQANTHNQIKATPLPASSAPTEEQRVRMFFKRFSSSGANPVMVYSRLHMCLVAMGLFSSLNAKAEQGYDESEIEQEKKSVTDKIWYTMRSSEEASEVPCRNGVGLETFLHIMTALLGQGRRAAPPTPQQHHQAPQQQHHHQAPQCVTPKPTRQHYPTVESSPAPAPADSPPPPTLTHRTRRSESPRRSLSAARSEPLNLNPVQEKPLPKKRAPPRTDSLKRLATPRSTSVRKVATPEVSVAVPRAPSAVRAAKRTVSPSAQRRPKGQPPATQEEKDIQQCTFHPQVHEVPHGIYEAPVAQPPGFNRAVERMAQGRAVLKKRFDENLRSSTPSNRRRTGATTIQPFRFETDKRERTKPLLYVDVNLGGGRMGRIGVHSGDRVETLAANFAQAYGLDARMKKRLEGILSEQISKEVSKKAMEKEKEKETPRPQRRPSMSHDVRSQSPFVANTAQPRKRTPSTRPASSSAPTPPSGAALLGKTPTKREKEPPAWKFTTSPPKTPQQRAIPDMPSWTDPEVRDLEMPRDKPVERDVHAYDSAPIPEKEAKAPGASFLENEAYAASGVAMHQPSAQDRSESDSSDDGDIGFNVVPDAAAIARIFPEEQQYGGYEHQQPQEHLHQHHSQQRQEYQHQAPMHQQHQPQEQLQHQEYQPQVKDHDDLAQLDHWAAREVEPHMEVHDIRYAATFTSTPPHHIHRSASAASSMAFPPESRGPSVRHYEDDVHVNAHEEQHVPQPLVDYHLIHQGLRSPEPQARHRATSATPDRSPGLVPYTNTPPHNVNHFLDAARSSAHKDFASFGPTQEF